MLAAQIANERLRHEAGEMYETHRQESHDSYLKSQDSYRASVADKSSHPQPMNPLIAFLIIWSAFVSTLLLVWLMFKS